MCPQFCPLSLFSCRLQRSIYLSKKRPGHPIRTRKWPDATTLHRTIMTIETTIALVFYNFRLQNAGMILLEELGWWVLLRSTTWFSQFVLFEFDKSRWIHNFQMPKGVVLRLASVLGPHIEEKNTSYHQAIL